MAQYTRYVASPPRRRGPRWLRVLKWTAVVVVACLSLTLGAMAAWLEQTAAQVAHNNPAEVKAASRQLSPVLPSQPLNILVIGSDRRVGQPDLGARSDTLIVVRLDPQTKSISMLSVPRDLRVDIPGYGLDKINAAYSLGGAKLAVETVKQVLGIPINDFIDVNFTGFVRVVDRLGGAYLMVDRRYFNNTALTDWASINLQPGYQLLSGRQALGFVRFRHDQNGDFTRIVRQQMFLREMKRQLASSATLTSFPRLLSVARIMSLHVVSDISSLKKIYSLLALTQQLDTNHIYQTHINGSTPMIGGVSYVVATQQQVANAVRQFVHPVRPPTQARSGTKAAGRSTGSTSPAAQSSPGITTASAQNVARWRALRRQTSLPLFMPTAWSPRLAYDQFRAYRVRVGHGSVPAAVVVGTTPQGGYWDVQAIGWTDPPILASPDAVRTIHGRAYFLYYDGARLRLVAWRVRGTTYWVSNTLDEELSNQLMLALATSSVAVK